MINSEHRNTLIIAALFAALFYFPLIGLDVFYRDDLIRAIRSFTVWEPQGRPLADILHYILTFRDGGLDIRPMPQILFVISVVFSGYIIGRSFDCRNTNLLVVVTFICISPTLLQNFSYRYDSGSMGLSILLSSAAIMASKFRDLRIVISAVLLLMSLCLYQSSINIFFALAVIMVANLLMDKGIIAASLQAARSMMVSFLAVIIYYYVVLGDSTKEGRGSVSITIDFITNNLISNTKLFYKWNGENVSIFLAFAIFTSLFIMAFKKINLSIKHKLFYGFLFSVSFSLIFFISINGITLVINGGAIDPRIWTFSGIALVSPFLVNHNAKFFNKLIIPFYMVIGLYFFAISFIYTNTLSAEYSKDKLTVTEVYSLLRQHSELDKKIYTNGSISRSVIGIHGSNAFSLIEDMTKKEAWWPRMFLYSLGAKNTVMSWNDKFPGKKESLMEISNVRAYEGNSYSIRCYDYCVVDFK
ncbi:glucosyltransferase domain-containing protein [Siccibacter colletis]|uniref:glucosyltransferase domain-containing protein n=1 Tax=Siccibacter colletis TaxID=1505757 RepID=UPI0004E19DF5|nr:glucosyltransferase domain-containing protein [Siccibacter colletis]